MKAAFYYGIGDIRVEECEIPKISSKEILIKVKASAICGTDLRIYKFGHFKIPQGIRRVLGHELAGEIIEIGADVDGYQKGMKVTVPPNVGCGHCSMCMQGFNQLCPDYEAFGISYDGGFQEYMRIPKEAIERGNVIQIPEVLSYEEAALVEPFSCTYHSYDRLKTLPGEMVVIVGAGPIGACHVMINKLAGAGRIIVADVSDVRLNEIQKFGADRIVNTLKEDLKEVVAKESNGLGANVVITACSVPEVQELALEIAGAHGRINFFGGMPKGKEIVPLNTNLIHYKELTTLATTGCSIQDYHAAMRIAASKKIPLAKLQTASFSLDSAEDAFHYALSGQGMKALIVSE